jgi:D-glycero-alpha-D-manno-heptose-7-phosphate kinase
MACQFDTGQQDQWSAVWGGANIYDFAAETVRPVAVPEWFRLYYTGLKHDAAEVLVGTEVYRHDALRQIDLMRDAFQLGDVRRVGDCLTAQWAAKFVRQPTETHQRIDRLINRGISQGAYGGKLVGAGDGGFLLFATDHALELGLREVPFRFDHGGARCM